MTNTVEADLQALAQQLHRVPGGAAAWLPDYFSRAVVGPVAWAGCAEAWQLADGGTLGLALDPPQIAHRNDAGRETVLVRLPPELLPVAHRPPGTSPLVLATVAIAMGNLDGEHALKEHVPAVLGGAKDLMLIAACRLCG